MRSSGPRLAQHGQGDRAVAEHGVVEVADMELRAQL
jgi:hypothetical protein